MSKEKSFIEKIVLILKSPHKFYKYIQKENGLQKAFFYYLVFISLSLVTNFIALSPSVIPEQDVPIVLIFFVIFLLLIIMLLLIGASSFFMYGLYHLIIKAFNGKKNYRETYKLLYAATPLLIVQIIPFYSFFKIIYSVLFVIAGLYTLYLEYLGLLALQKLSKKKAVITILIVLAVSIFGIILLNGVVSTVV